MIRVRRNSGTGLSWCLEVAITEDGIPLRHLFLPSELVDSFVALATSNTDRKVETCGLLLGTLKQNKFAISTLLIPQQKGGPDHCEMVGEELIFDASLIIAVLCSLWLCIFFISQLCFSCQFSARGFLILRFVCFAMAVLYDHSKHSHLLSSLIRIHCDCILYEWALLKPSISNSLSLVKVILQLNFSLRWMIRRCTTGGWSKSKRLVLI